MESRGVQAFCGTLAVASFSLVAWVVLVRLPTAHQEITALENACRQDNNTCQVLESRVLRRLEDVWAKRGGNDVLQGNEIARYLQITEDDAYLCSEDSDTGEFRAVDLNCQTRLLA